MVQKRQVGTWGSIQVWEYGSWKKYGSMGVRAYGSLGVKKPPYMHTPIRKKAQTPILRNPIRNNAQTPMKRETWLDFTKDCDYLNYEQYKTLQA